MFIFSVNGRKQSSRDYILCVQAGKTTAIRRAAVRETGVFWHQGEPIITPQTSQHYCIDKLQGGGGIWCREISVSRTAYRLIAVEFLFGHVYSVSENSSP